MSNIKYFIIKIPELLRDEIKVYSAKNKTTMNDFIIKAVEDKLKDGL